MLRRVLPTALLLVLTIPASAHAAGLQSANFTARISGSYAMSGNVTNTRCFRVDAQDNPVYFTGTGSASESTSFRSTRGALLGVSRTGSERRIVAGGPTIPVSAKVTRRSTLDAGSEPVDCRPNSPHNNSDCGSASKHFKLEVYGIGRGFGFSYNFSSGYSTTTPDNPFECPVPEGADWWGGGATRRGNGTAKVSTALLFNPRVKTIKVKGSVTKSPLARGSDFTAKSTETLRWALTLVRR